MNAKLALGFAAELQTGTPFTYELYGLKLGLNWPVPVFTELSGDLALDVRIVLQQETPPHSLLAGVPSYASRVLDPSGCPHLRIFRSESGESTLRFADGTTFLMNSGARQVIAYWSPVHSSQDIVDYLVGPFAAYLLALRGVTCLHGSAVACNQQSVAFVGPSNTGKSTVAAEFLRRGFEVVSDDLVPICPVDGNIPRWQTFPGDLRLRLRSSVVGLLPPSICSDLIQGSEKDPEVLELKVPPDRFQRGPVPLVAVYLFDGKGDHGGNELIEPASASEALITLSGNTWAHNILNREQRRCELAALREFVEATPIRRIRGGGTVVPPSRLAEAITVDLLSLRQFPHCAAVTFSTA